MNKKSKVIFVASILILFISFLFVTNVFAETSYNEEPLVKNSLREELNEALFRESSRTSNKLFNSEEIVCRSPVNYYDYCESLDFSSGAYPAACCDNFN